MSEPNKFDAIKLSTLILHVQQQAILYMDPKFRKRTTPTMIRRRMSELGEMRMSVINRLKQIGRSSSDFFPKGSLVTYKFPGLKPVNAVVIEKKDEKFVIIKIEGETWDTEVEACYLTLKHIRTVY